LLLQSFYGIRSERLLLEQLHYNLLFRWLVGLSPDDPIWHPTTFTKNHERLLNDDVMGRFLEKLIAHVSGSGVNPRGSQPRRSRG
jgi:transposase